MLVEMSSRAMEKKKSPWIWGRVDGSLVWHILDMFLFLLWKRWVSPPPWLKFSVPILNSSFNIEMGGVFQKTNQIILWCKIFPTSCQNVFASFSHCMVTILLFPCPKSSCIPGMCHNHTVLVISLAKNCHPQAEELFLWAEPVKKLWSWEHFSFWWIFFTVLVQLYPVVRELLYGITSITLTDTLICCCVNSLLLRLFSQSDTLGVSVVNTLY